MCDCWLRHICSGLLILIVVTGCNHVAMRGKTSQATWNQQIDRVRTGLSDRIQIADPVITNDHLKQLVGLVHLRELIVERVDISADGVAVLGGLAGLEVLALRGGTIDDACLVYIGELVRLRRLNLPSTRVTNAGLAALVPLTQLELLRLGSPDVSDDGMEWMAKLARLRFLHLIDVPITDRGLETVQGMHSLESFYLDGSDVSDEGLNVLIQARPDLHFHRDQHHLDRDPRKSSHEH